MLSSSCHIITVYPSCILLSAFLLDYDVAVDIQFDVKKWLDQKCFSEHVSTQGMPTEELLSLFLANDMAGIKEAGLDKCAELAMPPEIHVSMPSVPKYPSLVLGVSNHRIPSLHQLSLSLSVESHAGQRRGTVGITHCKGCSQSLEPCCMVCLSPK